MPRTAFPTSLEAAVAFDENDPLAAVRAHFSLPDGITYLVGHSLGPPPKPAIDRLRFTAEQDWAEGLVGSWNTAGWIDLPATVGGRIARLIGVEAEDVIVCDSVSINLFKLVGALISRDGAAKRIIVEAGEFPTDQYILERLAQVSGADFIRTDPGTGPHRLDKGGVLVCSLVDYRTAKIADVQAVEALARKNGGVVVWDLSHATGILDLKLSDWGVKYAVGCTYKHLNGGPGSPAFLYVDRAQVATLETPIAGWLGHSRPFAFENTYEAADGMQRFVAGTPPILSMAALNGALDIFETVSLSAIEDKAQKLGSMCLAAFVRLGLPTTSPAIGAARAGHVNFSHPDGYALCQALAERGHKTDFRTPTTIRFGLSPLFLSYVDVWNTLVALEDILTTESYRDPQYSVRAKVT
jgi:kynureninase